MRRTVASDRLLAGRLAGRLFDRGGLGRIYRVVGVLRRAAKIDVSQTAIVAALRKAGCQVQTLAAVGGGCPDLAVSRAATNTFLECKTKGGKLTPAQEKWHRAWRGPVFVVRTPEEALEAVGL